jgi:hypothetical protein
MISFLKTKEKICLTSMSNIEIENFFKEKLQKKSKNCIGTNYTCNGKITGNLIEFSKNDLTYPKIQIKLYEKTKNIENNLIIVKIKPNYYFLFPLLFVPIVLFLVSFYQGEININNELRKFEIIERILLIIISLFTGFNFYREVIINYNNTEKWLRNSLNLILVNE